MRFCVSVPVLSEQMVVTEPSVSTAGSLRIKARRLKAHRTPGGHRRIARAEIAEAIAKHPVVVVSGATGSGKSTQLPKICLEAGRGVAGLSGHTQPRRIAAQSIAPRGAAERAGCLRIETDS